MKEFLIRCIAAFGLIAVGMAVVHHVGYVAGLADAALSKGSGGEVSK